MAWVGDGNDSEFGDSGGVPGDRRYGGEGHWRSRWRRSWRRRRMPPICVRLVVAPQQSGRSCGPEHRRPAASRNRLLLEVHPTGGPPRWIPPSERSTRERVGSDDRENGRCEVHPEAGNLGSAICAMLVGRIGGRCTSAPCTRRSDVRCWGAHTRRTSACRDRSSWSPSSDALNAESRSV